MKRLWGIDELLEHWTLLPHTSPHDPVHMFALGLARMLAD